MKMSKKRIVKRIWELILVLISMVSMGACVAWMYWGGNLIALGLLMGLISHAMLPIEWERKVNEND